MMVCNRCGYVDHPADTYGYDDWGAPDWGFDGPSEFIPFGPAPGKCPICGASGDDWLED